MQVGVEGVHPSHLHQHVRGCQIAEGVLDGGLAQADAAEDPDAAVEVVVDGEPDACVGDVHGVGDVLRAVVAAVHARERDQLGGDLVVRQASVEDGEGVQIGRASCRERVSQLV